MALKPPNLIGSILVATPLISGRADSSTLFQFSYTFDSGAQLSGIFQGFVTPMSPQGPSPFDGTVTILGDETIATFTDISGTSFTWDTRLQKVSSSQASLIDDGESAFASFDGSRIDFVLSAGFRVPPQIFLENGIQEGNGASGTLNNASSNNLLPVDISGPFRLGSWSLTVVPEPSTIGLLAFTAQLRASGAAPIADPII